MSSSEKYLEAIDKQIDIANWVVSLPGRALLTFHSKNMLTADPNSYFANRIGSYIVDSLIYGTSFYWSEDTCKLIKFVSRTMPDWTMYPEYIPCDRGFMWFAEPFDILWPRVPAMSADRTQALAEHDECQITAMSWAVLPREDAKVVARAFNNSFRAEGWGVYLIFYFRPKNASIMRFAYEGSPDRPTPSHGVPFHFATWLPGRSFVEMNGDYDEFREPSIIAMRHFAAMLQFMRQRILVSSLQSLARPQRRRLQKSPVQAQPEVRVVTLRKKEYSTTGAARSVEWSRRWPVDSHWRNQWYPSLGRHQPKYIFTYVKGPPDKPLVIPKKTVYASVR